MASATDSTRVYADFSGFARLRADARSGAGGSTVRVARQFESVFVQMMLKSMRETIPESGLFGKSTRMFQDLFDRQVSLDLSSERGIGLADMLVRQIDGPAPASRAEGVATEPLRRLPAAARPPAATPAPASFTPAALRRALSSDAYASPVASGEASKRDAFGSPEQFVHTLLPHARAAGRALGVDPKVLLAQAALETGWGRHVMTDRDGRSAHNFFGIKADGRWDGSRVQVSTLESLGGVLERVRADFRAYSSPAEGFRDYAEFISGQGRYSEALDAAEDPVGYVRGLQDAGYATDPRYAEKILGILRRAEFTEMVRAREGAEMLREVF